MYEFILIPFGLDLKNIKVLFVNCFNLFVKSSSILRHLNKFEIIPLFFNSHGYLALLIKMNETRTKQDPYKNHFNFRLHVEIDTIKQTDKNNDHIHRNKTNKPVNLDANGPSPSVTSTFSILFFEILKDCQDISGFAFSSNMLLLEIREMISMRAEQTSAAEVEMRWDLSWKTRWKSSALAFSTIFWLFLLSRSSRSKITHVSKLRIFTNKHIPKKIDVEFDSIF